MNKRLIILSLVFGFLLRCGLSYAQGKPPVLYFSDLTDGPTSGWEGSTTKGAAVSIWGNNFGSLRGTSYVTVGGVNLTNDSDYAEWGVVNNPPPDYDGKTGYVSARGLERITFWLNSNMQTGSGTIRVTTADGTSNEIPFYCRNTGNIYFISRSGSDTNNGLYSEPGSGNNGPWLRAYKVKSLKAGDVAYFRAGKWNEEDEWDAVIEFSSLDHGNGQENKSIAVASYPGEIATIGDSSINYAIHWHGAAELDMLSYWTFSKFMLRSNSRAVQWDQYFEGGGSDHIRFIGNDMSTTAAGISVTGFTGQGQGQSYLYFYGNHCHDAGSDNRGDPPSPGSRAYPFYIEGNGGLNYIYIGWNEFAHCNKGRFQVYGHITGDWIDNLYIHDNYIHHMALQGAVLGGGDGGGSGGPYEFVKNCYFYNNIVADNGLNGGYWGIHMGGDNSGGHGGNWYIYNNLFYHNGGGEVHVSTGSTPVSIVMKNNILLPVPGETYYSGKTGSFYSGSNNLYYGAGSGPSWDTNRLDNINPQFIVDSPASDGDFQLKETSPCIDKGTSDVSTLVTNDYLNIIRPQGLGFDIGAYEYVKEDLLIGDVNLDGKVDIIDLILVAKDFNKTSGFNPGCDLNGDNKVDIKDLIIVAKNFGKQG